MSGKELFNEVKKEQEMQFVVVRKPKVILTISLMDDFPKEVRDLLDNFYDIVVDVFPNSLPPIRSINHHIDLIQEQVCQTKKHID